MAKEMREATFAILTALADGPRHGYGIIAEVADVSDGQVRLLAGTLYTALERLRFEGLIDLEREEIVQGRLRRFYALTELGKTVLQDEAERRRTSAQRALNRLSPKPASPLVQS
jgi:DNA-binding PadR family transcriptional regulator